MKVEYYDEQEMKWKNIDDIVDKFYTLKCSCCGYVPDEEDLIVANYNLNICDCGQEDVCDLCYTFNNLTQKSKCPKCDRI